MRGYAKEGEGRELEISERVSTEGHYKGRKRDRGTGTNLEVCILGRTIGRTRLKRSFLYGPDRTLHLTPHLSCWG